MRVAHNRMVGTLTIESCQTLRFMEGTDVRKFYQQMLVQFRPDIPELPDAVWSVSNWGPGIEAAPGAELRGGIKVDRKATSLQAAADNERQLLSKIKGGYSAYNSYSSAPPKPRPTMMEPQARLVDHLGLTEDHSTTTDTSSTESRMQQTFGSLRAEAASLASNALAAIERDDISTVSLYRNGLLELIDQTHTLQEAATGHLEVLNARLRMEISA